MTTEQLHREFGTIIQQAMEDQRACIGSPYYAFGYFEKFANKIRKEAASELSALQKENAELKKQVEWRKEHMEESDKELVQIQDWLRAGGDIFISSSEMMAQVKDRIRDLIAIEGEAGDLRTQVQRTDDMYSVARALVADQAKDIEYLNTQNRELRELLTDVLKSSDALWYEKQMGHDWKDCVDRINKALALQPEKVPQC